MTWIFITILIALDEMISGILSNRKLNPVVTELFIGERKLKISLVSTTQSYSAVPKKSQTKIYTLFYYESSKQTFLNKHSQDIHFRKFINFYKTTFLLVIDATLVSDNLSCFTKNLLEITKKLIIIVDDDKIRDEKLQYNINKEAIKITALCGKTDNYKYLTGEEILPSYQRGVIEQAKITYCPLGELSERQTKTTEMHEKKSN